jgi:hypothetical protein
MKSFFTFFAALLALVSLLLYVWLPEERKKKITGA